MRMTERAEPSQTANRTLLTSALMMTLAIFQGACSAGASAPTPASTSAPISTSSPSPTLKLSLAKTDGSSPVDREIERLERASERAPDKADGWIRLGQAWVRKAREAADPGFYLNAKACAD